LTVIQCAYSFATPYGLRGFVDLLRPQPLHQRHAQARIGQVELHQMQAFVIANTQLLETPEVDRTRAPVRAVNLVTLVEQKLR